MTLIWVKGRTKCEDALLEARNLALNGKQVALILVMVLSEVSDIKNIVGQEIKSYLGYLGLHHT